MPEENKPENSVEDPTKLTSTTAEPDEDHDAAETLEDMNKYCAKFMMSLFNLQGGVQQDLLDDRVRVNGKITTKETAVYHIHDWKNQFSAIKPLGYQPGFFDWLGDDFRFAQYSFMIGYEVTYPNGETATHEGVGKVIMQENVFDLAWVICVLAMPGFEL